MSGAGNVYEDYPRRAVLVYDEGGMFAAAVDIHRGKVRNPSGQIRFAAGWPEQKFYGWAHKNKMKLIEADYPQ